MFNITINLEEHVTLRIDIFRVLIFELLYQFIKCCFDLFRGPIKKNKVLTSYCVSSLVTWYFVITTDFHALTAYYIYDFIHTAPRLDYAMILHHSFSIYALSHNYTYPDHTIVRKLSYMVKVSDLFAHHGKIIDYLDFEDENIEKYANIYKSISSFITFVLWIALRAWYPYAQISSFVRSKTTYYVSTFALIMFFWSFKFLAKAFKK